MGWDTDQFPMDVKKAMLTMQVVLEQGGIAPGGLNFDAKVRRESTDLEDYFIGHIGAMDTFARGLKAAAALKTEGVYDKMLKERYGSYDSGFGKTIEEGKASMKDCEEYIHKTGEAKRISGKQEKVRGFAPQRKKKKGGSGAPQLPFCLLFISHKKHKFTILATPSIIMQYEVLYNTYV